MKLLGSFFIAMGAMLFYAALPGASYGMLFPGSLGVNGNDSLVYWQSDSLRQKGYGLLKGDGGVSVADSLFLGGYWLLHLANEMDHKVLYPQVYGLLQRLGYYNTENGKQYTQRFLRAITVFDGADSIYQRHKWVDDSLMVVWPKVTMAQNSAIDTLKTLYNEMSDLAPDALALDSTVVELDSIPLVDSVQSRPIVHEGKSTEKDTALLGPLPDKGLEAASVGQKLDMAFLNAVYTADTLTLRQLITGYDKESLKETWLLYRSLRGGEAASVGKDSLLDQARQNVQTDTVDRSLAHGISVADKHSNIAQVADRNISTGKAEESAKSVNVGQFEPTNTNNQVTAKGDSIISHQTKAGTEEHAPLVVGRIIPSGEVVESAKGEAEHPNKNALGNEKGVVTVDSLASGQPFAGTKVNDIQVSPVDSVELLERNARQVNEVPQSIDEFIAKFDSVEAQQPTALLGGDIEFVVQLFAARGPLTDRYIRAKYKGAGKVVERQEDGWYKYQIGHTNNYNDAIKVLNATDIKGAFVVAYRGNEKLSLWEVLHNARSDIKGKSMRQSAEPLVFVVQILALRQPAKQGQIEQFYSGTGTVREVEEDGWYKYQIVVGPSYKEAKYLWDKLNVKGAFVAAYLNGAKIEMKEAFKILRKQSTKQ